MKVLQGNAGLLSNFEVLDLLRSRGADKGPLSKLVPSELKVYNYLIPTPAGTQNTESLKNFLADTEPFNFTAAEKLQVLNSRPSTEVEVHLIVEDCDERLSSERVEQFLAVVEQTLPPAPSVPGAVEADGEDPAELGDGPDDMQAG